ncbi:putative ribonuclease H-like domain-containing protein [Tanacetum coccineum]|uniref:Ribonuclease H-like domain-containing protein n=1 Tax=Tanacetum coccineum TaxID=301880 RepID=A0ABQ5DN20_9ASTR
MHNSSKDVNAVGQQVNTASLDVNTGSLKLNAVGSSVSIASPNEKDSTEEEPEVDLGNITNSYIVPTTPNTRIHKDHPIDNVIGEVQSTVQTRRMSKSTSEQGFLSDVYKQKTHDTLNTCLYACFLSQIEPTSIAKALSDSSWVEAMQEELLQFKLQQVWILVDLPNGKNAIRTKWVFKNKKDEREIVIRNKARLVAQGHRQEEDDIIFGSTNKELCTGFEKLMKDKFQMSSMGELTFFLGLQVQQKEYGIFISQDKYVAEILKIFNYSDVKSAIDLEKPLVKDGDVDDVDVHLYRSMIGSLMYLTASRPDIMFAVWDVLDFKDSPFKLVTYTDSDYAGATLDRKSTTGGCQFVGNRLISWQCKKQTVVATSITKVEYVATASCCGQVKHVEYKMLNALPFLNKDNGLGSQNLTFIHGLCINMDPHEFPHVYLVGDEAVHKELGDRMERDATTASSLEAEQDSGSGSRCQDTILGDGNAQTRFEITSIQSIDPPLSRGYTLGSREDSMKLIGIDEILYTTATAKVQTVNGVRQIQALVDKKRVIITESSIRRDLHLDDAECTDYLPTATIFEELTRMGAKSTAWNEFSSSMASLIICLATNQKFNLSKYIFDAMVKHLDGGVKFLIYPRFLHVFINQQLGNMSTHKKIFVNSFHTKKVFATMKRAGKDFSGRITPLFDTMMVQPVEEIGEDSDNPTNSTPIPIIDQPSSSS